jgi:hypothetical protein
VFIAGITTNISPWFSNLYAALTLFLGADYYSRRDTRLLPELLMSIVFCGFAFGIYANLDWTLRARYFAPYLPFAFLLFLYVTSSTLKIIQSVALRKFAITALLIGVFSALGLKGVDVYWCLDSNRENCYPWYIINSKKLIEPSLWINENLPLDAVIATRRIGCLSYFGKRKVFDYSFGLTEPEIARLIREESGKAFDNPSNSFLKDIWNEKSPDYILEDDVKLPKFGWVKQKNEINIHGMCYKLIKLFPINERVNWVLAERK